MGEIEEERKKKYSGIEMKIMPSPLPNASMHEAMPRCMKASIDSKGGVTYICPMCTTNESFVCKCIDNNNRWKFCFDSRAYLANLSRKTPQNTDYPPFHLTTPPFHLTT